MTISQRIFEELKKQKRTQKELAIATGISTSTISAWNKKGALPSADSIVPLARELGVSVLYLLTGEESLESELPLSSDEMKLLENYRMLDHKQKTAVYEHASDLAKLAQLEENEALRQESAS